jgi:hypothetical protein
VGRLAPSCLWLGLGVESGSDRVRQMIRKDITEAQVLGAAATLGRHGIPAGYAFMVALPSETRPEMLATISLMLEIKRRHPQAQFAYQYFRPYPGSELYEVAVREGYTPPASLREWAQCQAVGVGYTGVDELPWIRHPRMVKYLLHVMPFLFASPPASLGGLRLAYWRFYRMFWVLSFRLRRRLHVWRGCAVEAFLDKVIRSPAWFYGLWKRA